MSENHQRDSEMDARQSVAGRFGFALGCVAFIAAAVINLVRAPRPVSVTSALLAVLMAALNIPLGIALGLLGERMTRPKAEPLGRHRLALAAFTHRRPAG
jgi:hypothetical protein